MAKYILEQIRIEGVMQDIISKSSGENVAVTVGGVEKTLAAALAEIVADVAARPTGESVNSQISTAIGELIGGAPETYDTLREIADYINENESVVDALDLAIGSKADKSEVTALTGTVSGKADKSEVTALTSTVSGKADQSEVTALSTTVSTLSAEVDDKADQSEVTALAGTVSDKADKSDVTALATTVGGKVDKIDGKGLSANDFTNALKTKLDSLKKVEASPTNGNIKLDGAETTVYTHPAGAGSEHVPAGGSNGQILTKTASGYAFADAPKGVRYGMSAPADMKDGELFVRVVG